ncbi:hypothetical protein [Erwinia rhapontici]|uniref:hypothetical protein n=1 Tax=Erwinia rhapontici TaxID=55212 RepID=UPI0013318855|nr:hypothetical protein [Erwinia rhapontici]MBP2156279.1 hypothetical protein [Erwinia rhapontici]
MKINRVIILLFAGMLSGNATAENEINQKPLPATTPHTGVAAGDTATSYATGNSLATDDLSATALAGVALDTSLPDGGKTSTASPDTTSTHEKK